MLLQLSNSNTTELEQHCGSLTVGKTLEKRTFLHSHCHTGSCKFYNKSKLFIHHPRGGKMAGKKKKREGNLRSLSPRPAPALVVRLWAEGKLTQNLRWRTFSGNWVPSLTSPSLTVQTSAGVMSMGKRSRNRKKKQEQQPEAHRIADATPLGGKVQPKEDSFFQAEAH